LNHLAINVNLDDPERVKEFISNKNVNCGFKGNLVKAYDYLALVNKYGVFRLLEMLTES
jgi:hypothetical protein